MSPSSSEKPIHRCVENEASTLPKETLHVIAHAVFERKTRLVAKRFAGAGEISLREILIMRVGIIEVVGLKICAQTFVENLDEFVTRARLARADIVNSAPLSVERLNGAFNSVLHVNEIAFLLAVLKNARSFAGLYLLREMINHACGHAFVRFARSVNIEITQPDDDPVRRPGSSV